MLVDSHFGYAHTVVLSTNGSPSLFAPGLGKGSGTKFETLQAHLLLSAEGGRGGVRGPWNLRKSLLSAIRLVRGCVISNQLASN